MNPNISNLYRIAGQRERQVIGLMSGTSLDGLDVALCGIRGSGSATALELREFETIPYDDDYRDRVLSVFSKRDVDLETVCVLNPWIGLQHAEMVLACLDKWKIDAAGIDLLASHGQTIYHAPRHFHQRREYPNATLQIGDGDHLARRTGIVTCSDFRQKHLAAGGEGAPLAVYGDYLIYSSPRENRILLNIGGIANLTWLPDSQNPAEVMSTDVGPGNTMMDAFVQRHYPGKRYDEDSALARQGRVSAPLLNALKSNDFLAMPLPKTIGPELFNLRYLSAALSASGTTDLCNEDQLATLCRFSSETIAGAIQTVVGGLKSVRVYSSGGGVHNGLLIQHIEEQLPDLDIQSTDRLGVEPDSKEAVVFAVLANECVAGHAIQLGGMGGDDSAITLGKLSFPE
ncbi:MAG: anhydro-N-acetylmuramic acid kinase [Pseudomonadota bacterium]